jgi:hypothetical protein
LVTDRDDLSHGSDDITGSFSWERPTTQNVPRGIFPHLSRTQPDVPRGTLPHEERPLLTPGQAVALDAQDGGMRR